jgi:hypothetical protein
MFNKISTLSNSVSLFKDSKFDCIGSGRKRTLMAFNPHNGSIYWDISFQIDINDNWNFYNAIVLPYDLDNDQVYELIISTGGNPTIPPEQHNRESGRVYTFSGRTGHQIGRYIQMPEDKETYMSPVMHVQKDGSTYLLFGSGGETVPGNLYIMSLPDFYYYITNQAASVNKDENRPTFKGNYSSVNTFVRKLRIIDRNVDKMFRLFKSKTKGVMVPPVLADVDNDGTSDILVMSFDGKMTMYNGETFDIMWNRTFECHEAYTSPAPGHFDDDGILDFMVAQNLGTFDRYKNSSLLVLSGFDGSLLWQMKSPRMEMASPLTIQTNSDSRDLFFFRIQGKIKKYYLHI